jgi:hypothetical protein
MNLKVGDKSPIKQEAAIIRDYYRDRATLGVEEAVKKWDPRHDLSGPEPLHQHG